MSLDLAMSLRMGTKHGKHGGGPPPAYTGPLDLTATPAVVAYGQRALSAAKLGTALITIADGAGGATRLFNSDAVTGASPDAAIQLYSATPFGAGWTDQSGNARDAAQAAGANQPQWAANIANSKPGLVFTGTAPTWLASATNATITSGSFTFFVVLASSAMGPSLAFFGAQAGQVSPPNMSLQFSTNYVYAEITDADFNSLVYNNQAGFGVSSSPHVLDAKITATTASVFVDNASVAMQQIATATVGTATFPIAIGDDDAAGNDDPFTGEILEFLIFDGAISDADRTAIRQNIASYYGITLS